MKFDGTLQDQSYEIVDELQIRKKLEAKTDWRFEFTKQTKYGYDLELYRWPDSPDGPDDRELVGYFELERADNSNRMSWVSGDIPGGWHFYSILKRKVFNYSPAPGICRKSGCAHRNVEWGDVKPEAKQAIFLKFNHNMDNCFAVPIPVVVRDGYQTKMSVECDPQNSYRALGLGHESVKVGIDNVVDLIDEWLVTRQAEIGDWG